MLEQKLLGLGQRRHLFEVVRVRRLVLRTEKTIITAATTTPAVRPCSHGAWSREQGARGGGEHGAKSMEQRAGTWQ